MTDRPIIFSAAMVRAILREIDRPGTGKTMTRRILKPQPPRGDHYGKDIMDWGLSGIYQDDHNSSQSKWWLDVQTDVDDNSHCEIDVRFAVGDILWVREAIAYLGKSGRAPIAYRANTDGERVRVDAPWRPSIHMPRWASRITLTVSDVKIERLQDISEADARAEGVRESAGGVFIGREGPPPSRLVTPWLAAVEAFRDLWESIHGPEAWAANPWVAAICFTPERRNIDAHPLPDPQSLLSREARER